MAWSDSDNPAGNTFADLLSLLIAGTKVSVVFALGENFNAATGWV
jgi:hypothetical protein